MSQTRPIYLVAVSGGSIYMGYSPINLTLCTNGAGALVDTPDMFMVDGPPSPNDTVAESQFHRHMYFCDGTQYKRLDGHTGEVRDWDAFNGTDAVSGDTIAGLMPFSTNLELNISGTSSGMPQVAGDRETEYAVGTEVALQGTDADGFYEVTGVSHSGGTTTITLDPDPGLSVTEGTIAVVTGRGSIMANWRGRCVIAGLPDDPTNWFASAVLDWLNWDYAPPTTSATQAVAGNAAGVGTVGDVITALIPFNDDLLGIGCRRSLWVLRGDPAAGGEIDNLSRFIGVVGPDAWTFDGSGTLYFVGADGLYRVGPNADSFERISAGILDATFAAIDYTIYRVILEWDRKRNYIYIFIIQDDPDEENPNSLLYDIRSGGFWPIKLPDENGPTAVTYFDAPSAEDRAVMLGGRDGYIRGFRDGRLSDRDTTEDIAITSNLKLGPYMLAEGQDLILAETYFYFDRGSGEVEATLYTGSTPEQAVKSTTPLSTAQLKRNKARASFQRVRGQSFVIDLTQSALDVTWVYGSGHSRVIPSGRTRRRR